MKNQIAAIDIPEDYRLPSRGGGHGNARWGVVFCAAKPARQLRRGDADRHRRTPLPPLFRAIGKQGRGATIFHCPGIQNPDFADARFPIYLL